MYHVYVPKISYCLPLRWYLGYLSVWMLAVDKRLCLLRWVHYICVVQRETKRESSPPTFRLGFLLVTPLARERRRSFEITYLGVKVHRPLSPLLISKPTKIRGFLFSERVSFLLRVFGKKTSAKPLGL